MFLYQSNFSTLQLKKDKGIDYAISQKSEGVYSYILSPQYTAFQYNIKLFRDKIGIKFDKDLLVVEQRNYDTKVVNTYIVYDLETWPKIPHNNFNLINCLFGGTNIVKINNKGNWVYTGYGIAFDGAYSWRFGNDMEYFNCQC